MFFKKSVSWLLVGAVVSFGVGAFIPAANAQTDLDPLEGLGTDDNGADVFGDTSDPYELIHRAILAPSMSIEEFQEQQNRSINGEALNFRQRQQELLQQQQQPSAATDEITVDGEEL